MTRDEMRDQIRTWDELRELDIEEGAYILESYNIVTEEDRNENINEYVRNWNGYNWEDLFYELKEAEEYNGYYYYDLENGWGEPVDDDDYLFGDMRERLLDYLEEDGRFEDEEEEEPTHDTEEIEESDWDTTQISRDLFTVTGVVTGEQINIEDPSDDITAEVSEVELVEQDEEIEEEWETDSVELLF